MGFFVVGGFFLTFCLPPCKTKPTSPLWSRGSSTTIRDLTHSPMLVPSGSFPDCELNSPQAAHQERDPTGNNMDLGNSLPATTGILPVTHTTRLVMLLNCSISPDLDEQQQNQPSQCNCLFMLLFAVLDP